MRIQCNKFPNTVIKEAVYHKLTKKLLKEAETQPSCRFYVFPKKDDPMFRVKVHVDGKVDFKKVAAEFKDKGVTVTETQLKAAFEA